MKVMRAGNKEILKVKNIVTLVLRVIVGASE